MNQIVTPVQPEISTPPPQGVNGGSGPVVAHGARNEADPQPFSLAFAHARNAGQNPPAAQVSSPGKNPLGKNLVEGTSEFDSEQVPVVVGALSAPSQEEASIVSLAQPDLLAVGDGQSQSATGEAGPELIPGPGSAGPGSAGGINPDQLLPSDSSDERQMSRVVIQPQKSDFSTTTGVNFIGAGHDADSGVLTVRQPANPGLQLGQESSSNGQVSKDELTLPSLSRGTMVFARMGEPVANLANTQTAASPEILSLEGFTRQTQYVLSSYVSSANSIPGVRANGVDNGTENIGAKLNARIEINAALMSEAVSSTINSEEMGAQEFGLDREESQLRDLSLSQHRATLASGSGATSLLADNFGDRLGSEEASLSRSGMAGERPSLLPSSLPQRLQMDITLADDSRVQIDVSVQQRQVSAHLVTDQTLLRNLAVQHEGQLVGQLSDAGLELKNFEAHVSDHSTGSHRESRDELHETYADGYNQDNFHKNSLSELVMGMVSERGLHFVA